MPLPFDGRWWVLAVWYSWTDLCGIVPITTSIGSVKSNAGPTGSTRNCKKIIRVIERKDCVLNGIKHCVCQRIAQGLLNVNQRFAESTNGGFAECQRQDLSDVDLTDCQISTKGVSNIKLRFAENQRAERHPNDCRMSTRSLSNVNQKFANINRGFAEFQPNVCHMPPQDLPNVNLSFTKYQPKVCRISTLGQKVCRISTRDVPKINPRFV